MALSDTDRNLLDRCLASAPRAWEDFVDRYMGLVVHVINHSAQCRSIRLSPQDREDLCAEVLLAIVRDDLAALRRFRGQSSLATYLTVIARRVVVRELLRRTGGNGSGGHAPDGQAPDGQASDGHASTGGVSRDGVSRDGRLPADVVGSDGANIERQVSDREEVERLLGKLDGNEATIVRMYHLEGKSYQEISTATGLSENSVGPALSRARRKMRDE